MRKFFRDVLQDSRPEPERQQQTWGPRDPYYNIAPPQGQSTGLIGPRQSFSGGVYANSYERGQYDTAVAVEARFGPSGSIYQRPIPPPPQVVPSSPLPYSPPPTSHARPPISKGSNLGLTVLHDAGSSSKVDIVFVHGLTGNAYNTWFHEQTQVHWPSQILPRDLPDCRILAFGFDADIVNFWNPASKGRISNHAQNLVGNLVQRRERTDTETRGIIFVCHSLGGLVVECALSHSRNSATKHIRQMENHTLGMAFLGVPHHGAEIAKWGKFGTDLASIVRSTNKELMAVLEPGSEMLDQIQSRFHTNIRLRRDEQRELEITCFWEELPVIGVGQIVPEHSAKIPGYECYGIHANHMGMTKFPNGEDPGYNSVLGELLRWYKAAPKAQSSVSPGQPHRDVASPTPEVRGMRDHDVRAVFDASVALRAILHDPRCSIQQLTQHIEHLDRVIGTALSHHRGTMAQAGQSDVQKNTSTLLSIAESNATIAQYGQANTFTVFVSTFWNNVLGSVEKRMEQLRNLQRMVCDDAREERVEAIFGGLTIDDFLIEVTSRRVK